MKKSQVSVEFMFALGVIFFIFFLIFGFMLNRNKELTDSETELKERNTCLLISSLLTSAFVAGDGVIINASIEYNASINFTDITSNYKKLKVKDTGCLLSVNNVPDARLREGNIRIQNQNNYIDIENV